MTLPPWPAVQAALGTWTRVLAAGEVAPVRLVLLELIEAVYARHARHGVWRAAVRWTALGEALGARE